jgi:hypothetical protein
MILTDLRRTEPIRGRPEIKMSNKSSRSPLKGCAPPGEAAKHQEADAHEKALRITLTFAHAHHLHATEHRRMLPRKPTEAE